MKRFVVLTVTLVAVLGCRREPVRSANLNAANKVAVRLVQLYYESPRMLLAPEPRNIALPESPAAAIPLVVRELMKGPAAATSLRLFPADTVVRGAWLLPGGTVIVDLGGATFGSGWQTGTHNELMAAYSLVQTLKANFPEALRVRLLINGTPAETLGGHLSLSRSLSPMPGLVEGAGPSK